MARRLWLFVILFTTGCVGIKLGFLNEQHGTEDPDNRVNTPTVLSNNETAIDYHSQVKPIIENRCVVCHGCYDAPCQLKLEAPSGFERGASKEQVYATRLLAAEPQRLFEESFSSREWRARGYFPVLNEREQTEQANKDSSLMYQMLRLKKLHPGTKDPLLDDSFDLSLHRAQFCPRSEEFADYADSNPAWGMPFGLPGLQAEEHNIVTRWLEQGAQFNPIERGAIPEEISDWEAFLNGGSLKQQLAARYIYEHLYLANLYFDTQPRVFYRLVRSSTPPGQALKKISTRRPYDDPMVSRVFYRLEKYPGTILAKNHMPYALNTQRMNRYSELFFERQYTVDELPGYAAEVASNPFKTFRDIPVKSRYEFMLDEARYTIMGFIKGPVCRGSVALDVIDDHFWVVFEDPDDPTMEAYGSFLIEQDDHLRFPASEGSTVLSPFHWRGYAQRQNEYLREKRNLFKNLESSGQRALNLSLIWDGEGTNENAALTIFRHFDSASIEFGFVGDQPKTGWLITYPLLERIHYLLVAGFDVYGNAGHQLETRMYMDFLRMEGEANFLELLPKEHRRAIHEHWYRDAEKHIRDYVFGEDFTSTLETKIQYTSEDSKSELFDLLDRHTNGARESLFSYQKVPASTRKQLRRLEDFHGPSVSILPEQFLVVLKNPGRETGVYSVMRNSAHSNITHLFGEEKYRLPAEDTLTVAKGFIGTYPNTFFVLEAENLPDFVDAVLGLKSEQDYFELKSQYGIRRTHPDFWAFSDALHERYKSINPIEAGLLDFNRLENR